MNSLLRTAFAGAAATLALAACAEVHDADLSPRAEPLALVAYRACPPMANCFYVDNTAAAGSGSLAAAVNDANNRPGLDYIHFRIPGAGPHVITPGQLRVTDSVVIEGYTQPGATRATDSSPAALKIVIDGSATASSILFVSADSSRVTGLAIHSASIAAITIVGNDNVVEGCHIGTDETGTIGIGNPGAGIQVPFGERNLIGGTTPGRRNVISANEGSGISLGGPIDTRIEGNYIGLDATGTRDFGNGLSSEFAGVVINGGHGNVVGGVEAGAGNVISGNANGIWIGASGNRVEGNIIGTDPTGSSDGFAFRNGNGVILDAEARFNTIGGTAPGAGNLISNQIAAGVFIVGDANAVQGNLIGTDAGGTQALPNAIGVAVFGNLNVIGGISTDARNVISGNNSGIQIKPLLTVGGTLGSPQGNLVLGNFIGVGASGTAPLGNAGHAVWIMDGRFNAIGGTAAGAGNVIAHSGEDGVRIESFNADLVTRGNLVLRNSIFANRGRPIDLGGDGPTANDGLGDPDVGPNGLQNAPEISQITRTLSDVQVNWTLRSAPATTYRLEFFLNDDLAAFGEGKYFLGATTVTTDATGLGIGKTSFPLRVGAGAWITATASALTGDGTSEFASQRQIP